MARAVDVKSGRKSGARREQRLELRHAPQIGSRHQQSARARRKEARPAEILAAALDIFAARGFAAAKLDEVAAKAGVSKGTLYLYYRNKEALFEAVVREKLGPEIDRMERMVEGYSGSPSDLLAMIFTQVATLVSRKEIAAIPKMVIAESGNFPDLAQFYFDNVIKRGTSILGRVIGRGVETGEFRVVDVPQAVKVLMAPILFLAQWRTAFEIHDDAPLDVKAFSRAHVDLALAALRRPNEGEAA